MKFSIVTLLILPVSFWSAPEIRAQTNTNVLVSPFRFSQPQLVNGGEIITREGVAYEGVVVQKVVPDGLVVRYSVTDGGLGIAKLNFKDLSDNLQQQFGYNPTNAAAFESEEMQAEGEWRAKLIADDERAQSELLAGEMVQAESQARVVGTGFFVTDNGYLLTCFHVVNNATSISVGTTQGLFPAELVQSDPAKDVALLKVAGSFASLPLVSGNNVELGEPVFTIGFPNPKVQGLEPKLTRGDISSLAGAQDDPDEYQISVPVQPGNSGGALIDENGNVVGIVAARLSDLAAVATSGMTAQDVNYAIKSSCARKLLDAAVGGPARLKPPYPPDNRRFEDVVQAAQDAVVLVLVK
ncbi:MAG: serine protease [Verrucomicrobiia bacterium]